MENETDLAGIPERVLAFGVDALLFFGGYLLSARLAFPNYPLLYYSAAAWWWVVWTGFFLLYQSFFAADGRGTLGQRLAGIGVAESDGSELGLDRALLRTVFFPISAATGLGLLAGFGERRQCWHDLVAGSAVVRVRVRTSFASGLTAAGAAVLLIAMVATAAWRLVGSESYENRMTRSYANFGLNEVAKLERAYREQTGHYADNLFDLAPLSGNSNRFMLDMANLFDLNRGFDIRVSDKGYTIVGYARDDERSVVSLKDS